MKNLTKLSRWLESTDFDGVILARRDNFKWITAQNANAVVTNAEVGVAYLVIKKDGSIDLIADSSDCPRMKEEQNALGANAILVPWYEGMDAFFQSYCAGKKYASDTGIAGTVNVQNELIHVRMQLSDYELERYRKIGQECAAIVEQTAKDAKPGQTEEEVARMLKMCCIAQGISPDCVLVGSDERILDYRHPVPTDKKIEKSLLVVLGGEKYGLNISMTRIVYYDAVPEEIQERMEKTQYVFAAMQGLMEEGMPYQEYFSKIQAVYAECGYPDEWKMHHQGGPTGYGCREFVIDSETNGFIKKNQAYAWNPTIQGTKCEETTYLGEHGIEIFTKTNNWPRTEVETPYGTISVADILRKG